MSINIVYLYCKNRLLSLIPPIKGLDEDRAYKHLNATPNSIQGYFQFS